jgi:hypothetical protein
MLPCAGLPQLHLRLHLLLRLLRLQVAILESGCQQPQKPPAAAQLAAPHWA